jgi:hypothetical protein
MKTCSCCKIKKPFDEFNKNKSQKDGHHNLCKECRKIERENNRQQRLKYLKNWRLNNIDIIQHNNQNRNKDKHRECSRNYYNNNKEIINKLKKDNRESINKNRRKRYTTDPIYRLKCILRASLKKGIKNKKTQEIIGCSWEELKQHLESQFQVNMTWDNHGQYGWHIDHIIPLASAKTEKEIYKLNYYTNLQPLWWEDNLEKRDKLVWNKLK